MSKLSYFLTLVFRSILTVNCKFLYLCKLKSSYFQEQSKPYECFRTNIDVVSLLPLFSNQHDFSPEDIWGLLRALCGPSEYLSFSVVELAMMHTGEEGSRKDERLGVTVHLMRPHTLSPHVRVKFRILPCVTSALSYSLAPVRQLTYRVTQLLFISNLGYQQKGCNNLMWTAHFRSQQACLAFQILAVVKTIHTQSLSPILTNTCSSIV